MMKRLFVLCMFLPAMLCSAPLVLNWYDGGLFNDSNGEFTETAGSTIVGNSFMTLGLNAGDPSGWSNVRWVKVRFWLTGTATNGAYSSDFAEYKYYPSDAHWSCLGPSSWEINSLYSKGPATTGSVTNAQRFTLVFKPSSLATATGASTSWNIRASVSNGTLRTNISMACRLRQGSSSGSSSGGIFKVQPNPFKIAESGTVSLVYDPGFSEECTVNLDILTIYGESVVTLAKAKSYLGGESMSISWNGKNGSDQTVASGIYSGRLKITYKDTKRNPETLLFNFAVFR